MAERYFFFMLIIGISVVLIESELSNKADNSTWSDVFFKSLPAGPYNETFNMTDVIESLEKRCLGPKKIIYNMDLRLLCRKIIDVEGYVVGIPLTDSDLNLLIDLLKKRCETNQWTKKTEILRLYCRVVYTTTYQIENRDRCKAEKKD